MFAGRADHFSKSLPPSAAPAGRSACPNNGIFDVGFCFRCFGMLIETAGRAPDSTAITTDGAMDSPAAHGTAAIGVMHAIDECSDEKGVQ